MGNVLRVLARDMKRIARVPEAWLVVLFLIVLPSFYTWLNVLGFWNPYENTGNLRICVVNEDKGAHDAVFGDLDLGGQIVGQLEGDDRLGWDFVDRDSAMQAVESGQAYAAFVIPEDFSADMATVLADDFTAPRLEYYVNEKAGPVSPKITDTGATTLDTTVNDTFVSTVSATVADGVNEWIDGAESDLAAAQSNASEALGDASHDVSDARSMLSDLSLSMEDAKAKADEAKSVLGDAKAQAASLAAVLDDVPALTGNASVGIAGFSISMGSVLDQGSSLLSQSSSRTSAAVAQTASTIMAAQGHVDAAVAKADAVVQENGQAVSALQDVCAALPEGSAKEALEQALSSLQNANDQAGQALDGLSALSKDTSDTADSVLKASGVVDSAVQDAVSTMGEQRSTFANDTVPSLGSGLGKLGAAAIGLSSSVSEQSSLIDQTLSALDEFKSTLDLSSDALSRTDDFLAGIQEDFDTASIDVEALASSNALQRFFGGEIDAEKVADFMMSPTVVQTERLYPVNAYGSAMAPLFINLTLWIGVFMMMVVVRKEVDDEGVVGIAPWQRYLGRWLFLAVVAALQAVTCVAGCLAIGVQTASVPAFFLTAIGISWTYLCIQYALSSTFQHVGMGLCVVLVFVQIPAATGLYPVEMTTSFFQALYPAFPFTHGIAAVREVVAGFYDGSWAHEMGVLAVFFAAFMVLGLAVRPRIANLNRLFARQLAESDLVNSEEVQLPARRYRIAQIVQVLSNREDYRDAVAARTDRFMKAYPHLKLGALVLGVVVPVVVTVLLAVTQAEKVAMLTVLLTWFVFVIGVLVVMEYVRDSLAGQADLESMSDEEVLSLYAGRNGSDGASSKGGAQ